MGLYRESGVSVESWVEMKSTVAMRYEASAENDTATLYFGQHDNYVLVLNRDNLAQVVNLGNEAIAHLDAHA